MVVCGGGDGVPLLVGTSVGVLRKRVVGSSGSGALLEPVCEVCAGLPSFKPHKALVVFTDQIKDHWSLSSFPS